MSNFVYMQDKNGFVFETMFPEYHKDAKKLTKKEGQTLRKEQSKNELLKLVKPGQNIFTVCRHVSASGMSRRISLFVAMDDDMQCIDQYVSDVTSYKNSEKGGLVASGCGMDMGFAIVYALGRALWPNGTPEPHGTRNGAPDKDGGYALKHRWL